MYRSRGHKRTVSKYPELGILPVGLVFKTILGGGEIPRTYLKGGTRVSWGQNMNFGYSHFLLWHCLVLVPRDLHTKFEGNPSSEGEVTVP